MLLDLADHNPCPAGAKVAMLTTADGVLLRTACWSPPEAPRGTVLLMQGRAEMIEKYFETIAEFLQKGFAVIAFDWRGQGGSQRLLNDPIKGHIVSFDDYQTDLDTVLYHYHALVQKPVLLLAHSMGGLIAMEALARRPHLARATIMSAPMFGIHVLQKQLWLKGLIKLLCLFGFKTREPPMHRSQSPFTMAFIGNPLTRDQRRFERLKAIVQARPALALGMPTLGWLNEALKAMNRLSKNLSALKHNNHPPITIFLPRADRVTATPLTRRICASHATITLIEIDDSEHEVLMESDPVRAQVWAVIEKKILPLFPA
jgi:lysophospholipase